MSGSERPNIVLISVDSLRADHCGLYGYEQDTTPNLSAIADESVIFENAVAPAAFTEQSMPAIFTGEFNMPADPDTNEEHTAKRPFLPELLANRGYSTAGFTPNPFTSRNFGFSRGFDEFHDFFGNDSRADIAKTLFSRAAQGDIVEAIRVGANMAGFNIPGIGNQSIPFRAYDDMVMDWVEKSSEPFFLWIFLLEVHSPYRPTKEYREMSLPRMLYLNFVRSHLWDRDPDKGETQQLLQLYDGTIRQIDDVFGTLMQEFQEYDPVFIVHSDHGESFGEHDNFGHNSYLYEENIHVPFIIANAGLSGRVQEPISLRELPDIVTEIADNGEFNPTSFTRDQVLARVGHEKIAARGEETKYILNRDSAPEYYDLAADPSETELANRSHVEEDALRRITSHVNGETEKQLLAHIVSSIEEGV